MHLPPSQQAVPGPAFQPVREECRQAATINAYQITLLDGRLGRGRRGPARSAAAPFYLCSSPREPRPRLPAVLPDQGTRLNAAVVLPSQTAPLVDSG